MMTNYIKQSIVLLSILTFTSCKKLIHIDNPRTQLTTEKAFSDDQTAVSVISNIYAQFDPMIDANATPSLGLYTDELLTTGSEPRDLEYYNGVVSVINPGNLVIWQSLYSVIYQSNSLLENIENSPNVTSITRQQLKGEAHFLRALAYFYLTNIYSDVPLLLSTPVDITSTAPRDSAAQVYSQIIADLLEAKTDLSESYPSSDKVRANKWAADALLARTYLYQGKWQMAELESNSIISSGNYNLDNLNEVFLKSSKESILQFWTKEGFTTEGSLFIPGTGSVPIYPISDNLINSFEPGDQRRAAWIDSLIDNTVIDYFPHKYKNRSLVTGTNEEYLSILRLSEQYLIRAEARAEQSNITGAKDDLNIVRARAGLANTTANDKATLLLEIEHERQVELFCEWGHRFFDLKRNKHINQVMSSLKPAWKETSVVLPIPQYERLNNPNLTQNSGY